MSLPNYLFLVQLTSHVLPEEDCLICLQEAICSSLEDYNKQIEELKEEMNDATHGADNIRNDISALAQRYAVIDPDEDCGVCIPHIISRRSF